MRKTIAIISIAAHVLLSAASVIADEKRWGTLTDEALDAYQFGKHEEAINLGRQALGEGERTFGPDHLNVAGSLDALAAYLTSVDDYAEAESLYRRALAILEKSLPSDDHYLAIYMDFLSGFYDEIGKTDEANKLRARAKAIRLIKKPEEEKKAEDKQ